MILKAFDIENWGCIKKLSIAALPATGVIVLHGRNRTGKSSLVRALRACLLDYPSTTTAADVKKFYPRGMGTKPTVSVTLRAGGASYRIAKSFGTTKSEFCSETAAGAWKSETTSAAEAHERVCALAKGGDSSKGLQQLLWLTQGEFSLPDAKKFDPATQSQLRHLLGVLQTPLDDRFIHRVKERWNEWHAGQRKANKQPALKSSCGLAQRLGRLEELKAELRDREEAFRAIEGLLGECAFLEANRADLQRQVAANSLQLAKLRDEQQRSQERIAAWRLAEAHVATQRAAHEAVCQRQNQRDAAARRLAEANKAVEPAGQQAKLTTELVAAAEKRIEETRQSLAKRRDALREHHVAASRVSAKRQAIADEASLAAARDVYRRARVIAEQVAGDKEYLAAHPAPDDKLLADLQNNRREKQRLLAERSAASIRVELKPLAAATPAELSIDGQPAMEATGGDEAALEVRRRATLRIPSWGEVEIFRGSGSGGLDEIESDLSRIEREFAEAVTSFGVAATAGDALQQLIERAATSRQRTPALTEKQDELKKIAPQGVEALRRQVEQWQAKCGDAKSAPESGEELPDDLDALNSLAKALQEQVAGEEARIGELETEDKSQETALKKLRDDETKANKDFAARKAELKTCNEQLEQLPAAEELTASVQEAERSLREAESRRDAVRLTSDETTIESRLEACQQALFGMESQLRDVEKKYHVIKGRLEQSEGLHAQRASLAARVDELSQRTAREEIERQAVDRLYELFEECRDKQLGALMTPIHDRVLPWMRALQLGDYNEVKFSDSFLPQAFVRRDGTGEFTIEEESTGAQEQFGMLVRLALGGLLTAAGEPEVAILDDPLTHCDVGRLHTMRGILRRAAEGDPNSSPPAAPLQIIVLTCHPEWFRDERAMVIDLEDPGIMQRFPD